MTVTRQGRGFLVRPYINGKRTTLGTVPIERCANCWEEGEACGVCEAKAKLVAQEWHDRHIRPFMPSNETCDSFAGRWLRDYPRPRESTNYTYRRPVAKFGKDFAGRKLRSITRPEAREWAVNHRYAATIIAAMFNDALRDGLIPDNPFANLRLPQSKGRAFLSPLTKEEVHRLAEIALEVTKPDQRHVVHAAILTLAYTGIRPGELFALRHEDIDLEAGEVTPRYGAFRGFVGPTKTNLVRSRLLPQPAIDAIRQIPRHLGCPYVFPNGDNRFSTGSFNTRFRKVRDIFERELAPARRAELEASRPASNRHLAPYELRHFAATYLLDNGASIEDVAYQLGHANSRLVASTYGHPNEKLIRERLRRVFSPSPVTQLQPQQRHDAESETA